MLEVLDGDVCAQGDLQFVKIDSLPDGLIDVLPNENEFVISHSETGHAHVINVQEGIKVYQSANDNTKLYLVVDNTECALWHKRDYDTHAPYKFGNGIYEIRRQIESDDSPEGWRIAID